MKTCVSEDDLEVELKHCKDSVKSLPEYIVHLNWAKWAHRYQFS